MDQDVLLQSLCAFVRRNERGPTPEEVHDLANFGKRGGISRLCAALAAVSTLLPHVLDGAS